MKTIAKNVTALGIGLLSLAFISNADAQHRGGGGRVSIGFGGRFGGVGFGYRGGGYYRPYGYGFYPSLGLSFGYLPYGYYPFYYGPDLYYGYDGVYYQQHDNSYLVVAPPVGAEVPKLPSHAKSIMIDGQQYYELSGVYYKEVINQDNTKGYIIAGKDGVLTTDKDQADRPLQVGDIVDQLPQDCRTVTLNGKKYYVSPDDVYYQEDVDNGGTTAYKVVGLPTPPAAPAAPIQNPNSRPQPPVHDQE